MVNRHANESTSNPQAKQLKIKPWPHSSRLTLWLALRVRLFVFSSNTNTHHSSRVQLGIWKKDDELRVETLKAPTGAIHLKILLDVMTFTFQLQRLQKLRSQSQRNVLKRHRERLIDYDSGTHGLRQVSLNAQAKPLCYLLIAKDDQIWLGFTFEPQSA